MAATKSTDPSSLSYLHLDTKLTCGASQIKCSLDSLRTWSFLLHAQTSRFKNKNQTTSSISTLSSQLACDASQTKRSFTSTTTFLSSCNEIKQTPQHVLSATRPSEAQDEAATKSNQPLPSAGMWYITNQALPFITSLSLSSDMHNHHVLFFPCQQNQTNPSFLHQDPLLSAVLHHKPSAPFITSGVGASHSQASFYFTATQKLKQNPVTHHLLLHADPHPFSWHVMHHKPSAPFITSLLELPSTCTSILCFSLQQNQTNLPPHLHTQYPPSPSHSSTQTLTPSAGT